MTIRKNRVELNWAVLEESWVHYPRYIKPGREGRLVLTGQLNLLYSLSSFLLQWTSRCAPVRGEPFGSSSGSIPHLPSRGLHSFHSLATSALVLLFFSTRVLIVSIWSDLSLIFFFFSYLKFTFDSMCLSYWDPFSSKTYQKCYLHYQPPFPHLLFFRILLQLNFHIRKRKNRKCSCQGQLIMLPHLTRLLNTSDTQSSFP